MKSIEFRALLRTIGMLLAAGAGVVVVYLFAILGMLPGVIILCGLGLVFIMYDTNKSMIKYEDKLNEMLKDNEKKVL
jgi:hypothetical protein